MPENTPPSPASRFACLTERVRHSLTVKLVLIGAIILLLQIPTLMIYSLIAERQSNRNQAVDEMGFRPDGNGAVPVDPGPRKAAPPGGAIDDARD